jgi:hypothetical protein
VSRIEVVVSDFGGVLTTPLMHAFATIQEEDGLDAGALGEALGAAADPLPPARAAYDRSAAALA